MGRKLTAEEIDFLFSACFFMDSISKDKFFRLLVEHFCDCEDKKKSSISAFSLLDTDRGLDSDQVFTAYLQFSILSLKITSCFQSF